MDFSELETSLERRFGVIAEDEKRAEDAFYRDLEFGTGGMRGEIGAGTNRMNTYTIRKATTGLASYIKAAGADAMTAE